MDEFACIRSFITVVEAGSFSAAARRGNVSTSAVARMVKSLEDELGVRLLNRNTRHQSLTEVGLAFYDRVRAIANDLAMAAQTAGGTLQQAAATLLDRIYSAIRVNRAGLIELVRAAYADDSWTWRR